MFHKDKLINELERFIEFFDVIKLTKKDSIDGAGLQPEEFYKYPEGTPGVHLYWDSEMEQLEQAKALLEYFKTGVISEDPKLQNNYIKIKIATINHLILNPQFETIMIGECGRGIEILLSLIIKPDCKKIICYDYRDTYKRIIDEFFKDDRVIFYHQQSCHFDPFLIKDDKDILFILSHSPYWSLKHFINWSFFGKIIKDGVAVDVVRYGRDYKKFHLEINFDEEYENLQKESVNKYG